MNESTLVKVVLELPAEVVAYFDELSENKLASPEDIMVEHLTYDYHYLAEVVDGEEDTL